MGEANLRKMSLMLYLSISRPETLTLCLVGVPHLLEIQGQQKTFIISSLQKNNCLRFLVN